LLSFFNKATDKANKKYWEESNAIRAKRSVRQQIQSKIAESDNYNHKDINEIGLEAYKIAKREGLLTPEENTVYNKIMRTQQAL
jgi:hypothetical protein